MSLRQRLARLASRLQEPQKVARFQQLCGVEALPSGSAAASADRREDDEEAEARLTGGSRRRGRQPGPPGGPQPPGSDLNQCPAKLGGGGGAPNGVRNGLAAELGPAPSRRAGALRRNSLTGEEGQLAQVSNWPLYYLFTFGTELGNELFYVTFFPFWIWNLDPLVGRRLVVIWVLVMYLGQCTKDIIRWPRPASPPVVKLEVFYNSEYSMPSTHAMSGTAIPISMVLLTYGRWQDIIAGFLYTILILAVFYPFVDLIDNFNQTHKYAPLIIIGLHLALGIFSFTLDTWSTSRGDTAEILGSGAGIACGSHVIYNMGVVFDPSLDILPLTRPPITVTLFGKAILRILIGMAFVLIVRVVMKKITIPLACKIFSIPCDDVRKARQHMEVELPYRYITYGMVGFSITCLVPYIFFFIGIS
ncbi:sphingosine-1-phosphate phosphatase 1 isoform X2 [Trichechus manatus latirostris]|uniref:Sphingosine-1-phosphate phosphatase 1 isoform X2 n=1 Tax=Trichechus manatus latirostris TaxID=127582 RepID=A0A2Y9QJN7_TRIMA|nr:sphingosine-1-phosphate phosphatase 1 isoform X2 [Trichechus manatus latirostris]